MLCVLLQEEMRLERMTLEKREDRVSQKESSFRTVRPQSEYYHPRLACG